MNPPESPSDPHQIRSQIDHTRQRMDQTIDALGRRLSPRHLADEALGYIRTQTHNGNMTKFKNQLSRSASSAADSVMETVKENPIPAALIGAGIAYYFYARNREDGGMDYRYTGEGYQAEAYGFGEPYVAGMPGREPGVGERLKEKAGELKERSKEAMHAAGEKMHEAGDRVRERAHDVAERARYRAWQAKQRSKDLYRQGRERVATTIERNPLESGLVCLALGLIAGVALPTSPRVRRQLAPRARQMREEAEQFIQRGKTVARTAFDAARQEAQAQGLTPDALQAKAGSVGNAATGAARGAAQEQELFGRQQQGRPSGITQPVTP